LGLFNSNPSLIFPLIPQLNGAVAFLAALLLFCQLQYVDRVVSREIIVFLVRGLNRARLFFEHHS
jgi:hypothetical protein